MQQEPLLCVLKKRFVATTNCQHNAHIYPNRLKALTLGGIEEAWVSDISDISDVSDITYIRLPSGFCYLAAILDAFSRRCVGAGKPAGAGHCPKTLTQNCV